MNRVRWRIFLAVALIMLAGVMYLLYYALYRDSQTILTWLLMSTAFLPINILIVTLIVDGIISKRDKQARLKKLNMVVGVFYSDGGIEILKQLSFFNSNKEQFSRDLICNGSWARQEFGQAAKKVQSYDCQVDSRLGDLKSLQVLLAGKKDLLLRLLENPHLLEHETFTDLLWAVFHLQDELIHRGDLTRRLSRVDYNHISQDMNRAYRLLISEWLSYMGHLKNDYPHLYSLAVRINPFDPAAAPEIKE